MTSEYAAFHLPNNPKSRVSGLGFVDDTSVLLAMETLQQKICRRLDYVHKKTDGMCQKRPRS